MLEVLAVEGLQLSSFPEIGPGWRNLPHPRLSPFQGQPHPIIGWWRDTKAWALCLSLGPHYRASYEVSWDCCDSITVPVLSLPSPASLIHLQVLFPTALPSKLPALDFHLGICFTGNSIQNTSQLPNSFIWYSYSKNFLTFLICYCLLSLALWVYTYFFSSLLSFQWYFYKASGINTCVQSVVFNQSVKKYS